MTQLCSLIIRLQDLILEEYEEEIQKYFKDITLWSKVKSYREQLNLIREILEEERRVE